jgi:hypothetical protein
MCGRADGFGLVGGSTPCERGIPPLPQVQQQPKLPKPNKKVIGFRPRNLNVGLDLMKSLIRSSDETVWDFRKTGRTWFLLNGSFYTICQKSSVHYIQNYYVPNDYLLIITEFNMLILLRIFVIRIINRG